jgi:hypothetical protein
MLHLSAIHNEIILMISTKQSLFVFSKHTRSLALAITLEGRHLTFRAVALGRIGA